MCNESERAERESMRSRVCFVRECKVSDICGWGVREDMRAIVADRAGRISSITSGWRGAVSGENIVAESC